MEKERESVDPVQSGVAVYDDSSLDLPPPLYPYNNNDESYWYSDRDTEDEYCLELDAYLYRFNYQTIDTINAFDMLYDIHDMFKLRLDPFIFNSFIQHSNYRNCLNYFDALGDPRFGGFYHIDGPNIPNDCVKPAKFALDYYSTHCNPDAKLKFVNLEKVTCRPCSGFHYVTFTAHDEVADVERIYQALVLEYDFDDYNYAKYLASADQDHNCVASDKDDDSSKYVVASPDKDDVCAKYVVAADKDDDSSKYVVASPDKDDDCAKYVVAADKDGDCANYAAAASDKGNNCAKYSAADDDEDYDFLYFDDDAYDVDDANYILGMLRVKDPTHDHVLAIIQLKPGVTHDDLLALDLKRYNEPKDDWTSSI